MATSEHHRGPEYRTVETVRAAGDEGRTLDVTFARFDVWNEIASIWEGNFLERLQPGAFAQTFAERRGRIRCLFQHGRDPLVGDKPLGVVTTLEETDVGPHAVVDLLDRSYVDDIRAGLLTDPPLYGASYRFGVVEEQWNDDPGVSDHNPKGLPERTILRLNCAEFGPVTFPADEGTQELIGVRSLTDRFAAPDRESRQSESPEPVVVGPDAATRRADAATAWLLNRRKATT